MARKKHQWTRSDDSPDGELHYTERATWASQKQASREIADLSKELVRLKAERLDMLPLSEALRDAIDEAHRLKRKGSVRGGMRRQMLFIASVIRKEDPADMIELIDKVKESRTRKRS